MKKLQLFSCSASEALTTDRSALRAGGITLQPRLNRILVKGMIARAYTNRVHRNGFMGNTTHLLFLDRIIEHEKTDMSLSITNANQAIWRGIGSEAYMESRWT